MRFIARLLLNTVGILFIAYVIPGISVSSFWMALLFAFILGIINAIVRPLLILLTLPVTILTIGLFTLVINALTFWLASLFVFGVEIDGFTAAFWGGALAWIVSWITNQLIKEAD